MNSDLSPAASQSQAAASQSQMDKTVPSNEAVEWVSLGRVGYEEALSMQMQQAERLLHDETNDQVVFTVEHPPTITIGKNGSRENILVSDDELSELGFQVFNVDRGGDVTYHGPGQLVVYPVLHLNPWQNDVSRYVRMLEEVVLCVLSDVGITGRRLEGYPGVWVGNAKVCAIGARVKRRKSGEFVTSHGLALNVLTNLSHFQTIIPCGIVDKGVTSIAELLQQEVSMQMFESRMKDAFVDVFEVIFEEKR
jgi:lipoyl(octanoyl) transferase